tara:strand:+ start:1277 stop:1954 length:678 start_codon:yes stop_codon:yes gene_type:complete
MPSKKNSKPKSSKSTKSTKPVVVAAAPVAVAAAPVAVAAAPVVAVAAAPVVAVAPVAAAPVAEHISEEETDSTTTIETEFNSLTERLTQLKVLQTSILSDLKKLQKSVHKHVKECSKKQKKKRCKDPGAPKRAPSGFAKPALISTQLCNFLGKPEGTEMARTEVTKYLTKYIKEHNLQDQANRRKILPDNSLQKLLNVGSDDEVTYFNLQKYMKVHFPKKVNLTA